MVGWKSPPFPSIHFKLVVWASRQVKIQPIHLKCAKWDFLYVATWLTLNQINVVKISTNIWEFSWILHDLPGEVQEGCEFCVRHGPFLKSSTMHFARGT